ncbi:VanW family protein [Sporomusa malonica]|uniref:VanW like protein n=2 Tax=Sporomusa malonica TaxID=112901 RepID=A0A1W2E479_9FIRM|nr:VanW family protein [Sporomusa malonica]SMD04192.1 VanW like protein [Sporomusa malonica]
MSVGLFMSTGCGLNAPAPKPESKLVPEGVIVAGQPVGGMSAEEAGNVLTNLAKAKDVPAVNAGFDPVTGEVMPERPGQRLDVAATMSELLAAGAGSSVTPVYQPFLPDITREALARARRLSTYTTPILDNSPGRLVNIRLTAKLINNALIDPGQEFSFNKITGEPTAARGFQSAAVFGDNGEKEQGLGGGMCQVSSTLYNAAQAAELKVTERHPHSQPVAYVPQGKDATTYTDKDLRFLNTTRWRLITRAFVHEEGSKLTVDLWALPGA